MASLQLYEGPPTSATAIGGGRPGRAERPPVESSAGGQADPTRLVTATLTSVQTVPCEVAEPGLPGSTCIRVRARPDEGDEVELETTDPTGATFRAGQRVRLSILEQAGQPTFYNLRDLERGRPMLALATLFMLAVVVFGRWQGVRSLIGLACSFAVIVGFIVPAILRGASPVPVTLVGAMAIMLTSLYLAHGFGRKTTAAVVGTSLALGLTGVLTAAFVDLAALAGLASEEAVNTSIQVGGISLQGAAAGRDHIAATVNTLFLAYAGASLPLLVLFVSGGDTLGTVATSEAVAVEIVRTLCGSVGLIAAVPLTTLLAAGLALEEPATGQGPAAAAGSGRVAYAPARGLGAGDAAALFGHVLDLHGPALATAVVGVAAGGSVDPGALPEEAREAAARLRRLAASARQEGTSSWYRRALKAGTVRLDLADPGQRGLLRHFGAFSTDTRVWVEGDPEPVAETADGFDELPRASYRLDAGELDRLQAVLARDGPAAAMLVPRRRSRARPVPHHH